MAKLNIGLFIFGIILFLLWIAAAGVGFLAGLFDLTNLTSIAENTIQFVLTAGIAIVSYFTGKNTR